MCRDFLIFDARGNGGGWNMPDDHRRPPEPDNGLYGDRCRVYTPTSYGQYAEGLGTLRASGGDWGGSEMLILESNQNHATVKETEICPTLPASMGMGGIRPDDCCAETIQQRDCI